MKRLFMAIVSLCVAFGAIGCGPKTTEQPVSSSANDQSSSVSNQVKGEITFATWGSLDEKKLNEEIIASFEKEFPGTKVNLEYIPDNYVQKIDTEMMGGTAPDVIYGHPHYFASWASKGLLLDLDQYFTKDNAFLYDENKFTTSLYEAFMWNGKHIATINGSDTFLLFYNKDMFDKAGVTYPDDNWTWDDFVAAGQKLTIMDGDSKQYGFTVSSWPVAAFPIIYSFGGNVFDNMNNPTKVTFDSPETVAGLQFYQDLIYKYKIAPTVQDTETLGGSFDTGKVAMDITGMYAVVSRKNITDFKWDVANLPMVKGKPRRTIEFFAGYAVYKNTKNPDLAWEFAKYMQSDAAQKILAGLGLITVINHQIASSDEINKALGMPEHNVLRVTSVDYASNGYAFLTNWDEILAKAIQPSYDQLLANTLDPATAAKTIQVEIEKLYGQSGKQQ